MTMGRLVAQRLVAFSQKLWNNQDNVAETATKGQAYAGGSKNPNFQSE